MVLDGRVLDGRYQPPMYKPKTTMSDRVELLQSFVRYQDEWAFNKLKDVLIDLDRAESFIARTKEPKSMSCLAPSQCPLCEAQSRCEHATQRYVLGELRCFDCGAHLVEPEPVDEPTEEQ
jgi:hypothetical protein